MEMYSDDERQWQTAAQRTSNETTDDEATRRDAYTVIRAPSLAARWTTVTVC